MPGKTHIASSMERYIALRRDRNTKNTDSVEVRVVGEEIFVAGKDPGKEKS